MERLRNALLPPDLVAGGRHEVVVVHEDVDEEVERDDNPRHRRAAVELSVAQDGRGGVVEDVEELEGLLLDDEEDGVKQLPVCARRESRVSKAVARASDGGQATRLTLELQRAMKGRQCQ